MKACLRCQGVKQGFGLSCQLMEQEKVGRRQSTMLTQNPETGLQLQQALEQICIISTALCDIQRHYQDQVCVDDRDKMNSHSVFLCS